MIAQHAVKHVYSFCLVAYGLWWVSGYIIISDEGFDPAQDLPWLLLFSTILASFWGLKVKLCGDRQILFYQGASRLVISGYLSILLVGSLLMLFFS